MHVGSEFDSSGISTWLIARLLYSIFHIPYPISGSGRPINAWPNMAIEDALRLAGQHGSSLTSSFWFGKFLQLLHDEEAIKEDHPLSLSSFRTTLSNHDSSINTVTSNPEVIQRERIQVASDFSSRNCEGRRPQIEEALKCLKHCETSLSPNVYDLVINSTHSIPSRLLSSISESSLLLNDSTLDWNTVSVLFDKGRTGIHMATI